MPTVPLGKGTPAPGNLGRVNVSAPLPVVQIPLTEKLLQAETVRQAEKEEAAAVRNVQNVAIDDQRAQEEGLAGSPEGLAARYDQAYKAQAETVYVGQLGTEALTAAGALAKENPNDPEAFASGWKAYTEGQKNKTKELPPKLRLRTDIDLEATGDSYFKKITENAAAQIKQETELKARAFVADLTREASDQFLNAPDEEQFLEVSAAGTAYIDEAIARGVFSPVNGQNQKEALNSDLAHSFARGKFRSALRRGDLAGARAVINQLENGRWFDDNKQAATLASSLASDLKSQLTAGKKAAKTQFNRTVDRLKRLRATVGLGGISVPPGVTDTLALEGFKFASDGDDQREIAELRNDIGALEVTMEARTSSPVADLQKSNASLIVQMNTANDPVSVQTATTLVKANRERIEEIQKAQEENDVASLVPLPVGATVEQREARAVQAAHVAQWPPSMVNLYAEDERETLEANLSDPTADDEFVSGELAGYLAQGGGDFVKTQALISDLSDPEVKGMAALAVSMTPDTAALVHGYAEQGRKGRAEQGMRALNSDELLSLGVARKANAAANGDGDVRVAVGSEIVDSVYGYALEYLARDESEGGGDVELAIKRGIERSNKETAPLSQTTTLANGAVVLDQYFNIESGALQEGFDDLLLNHPGLAGIRADATSWGGLRPFSMKGGILGVQMGNAPGVPLVDSGGELIVMDAERVQQEFALARDIENRENPEESYTSRGLDAVSRLATRWMGTDPYLSSLSQADATARAANGSSSDLQAVLQASHATPAEQKGDRNALTSLDTGWSDLYAYTSAYRAAYKRALTSAIKESPNRVGGTNRPLSPLVDASGDAPLPATDGLGAQVAATMALDELAKMYPGDKKRMYVGYFLGPEGDMELAEQEKATGKSWEALAPNDAAAFAERATNGR